MRIRGKFYARKRIRYARSTTKGKGRQVSCHQEIGHVQDSSVVYSPARSSVHCDVGAATVNTNTNTTETSIRGRRKKFARTEKVLRLTISTLLFGIKGAAAAGDAFPPVKSAAAGLLFRINSVKKFKDDKADIEQLSHLVEEFGSILEDTLLKASFPREFEAAAIHFNR
ncbi:uncharacterized protein FOMMEDRAFT_151393 [Fomitiporia mediterranea MF3/22]|uniref:uncharacterized protein n=1 Tax=Fomitiporia mediterranea (strain MF3/22) TaxID=694068 RepID=UPI0004407C34|nr:uncharacterized protein FOMMEDRAFT_151393 [Fomitiporia mediterranea MF3/22]EJD08530.1 hypothetical protein FOMMEDRAFT_151393 [Fomitiporia mediterranea MF3/22]